MDYCLARTHVHTIAKLPLKSTTHILMCTYTLKTCNNLYNSPLSNAAGSMSTAPLL